MAGNKEAIGIVLDVGPSMNQAPRGEETPLQTAIAVINMILQRKMFSKSKDEVCVVLFGTPDTDNPLADDNCYQNITVARSLHLTDFDLLQFVQNDIEPSNLSADFVNALVVTLDHLISGIQGKQGFGHKRLILFSDLGGEFGDNEIKKVIGGIRNTQTELNIIGPAFEDGDAGPSTSSQNSERKEKTSQQKSGEDMVKRILKEVNGECYSFREVLPALSHFISRPVHPTAWNCNLEIGSNLKIPISGYIKVKDFQLDKSWKKVYALDTSLEVGNLATLHMDNDEETEVKEEDTVSGYHYGNTLVPMSSDDKKKMDYKSVKCFKVLDFIEMKNVKRQQYMGDSVTMVVAEKGDDAAGVALSALINALYDKNMVAIVSRVFKANSAPKLGFLSLTIKSSGESLMYTELPFSEDIRHFKFGSLPIREDNQTNKKYAPSVEQLSAIDDLITSMDLVTEDKDGDHKCEALKPKAVFNPYFQRLYQCLQHRALNPEDPIMPELSPLVAKYLKPPQEVIAKCQDKVNKIRSVFKLEVNVEKKKEHMFKRLNVNEEAAPSAKRPRTDDSLEGGIPYLSKVKVTEVGTVTPVEDFCSLIGRKDEDLFEEACSQMQERISEIVMESFGGQFYGKAMDCIKVLREQLIKGKEPNNYNTFVREFKGTLISKGRRDFWDQIVAEKCALIDRFECEESDLSVEEAATFTSGEVKDKPVADVNADDLL